MHIASKQYMSGDQPYPFKVFIKINCFGDILYLIERPFNFPWDDQSELSSSDIILFCEPSVDIDGIIADSLVNFFPENITWVSEADFYEMKPEDVVDVPLPDILLKDKAIKKFILADIRLGHLKDMKPGACYPIVLQTQIRDQDTGYVLLKDITGERFLTEWYDNDDEIIRFHDPTIEESMSYRDYKHKPYFWVETEDLTFIELENEDDAPDLFKNNLFSALLSNQLPYSKGESS